MALSSSMYFLILQTYKPYTATRFFVPIIAITPFEQVLAEPDFEFLVRLHRRQRGRKIIKEQL